MPLPGNIPQSIKETCLSPEQLLGATMNGYVNAFVNVASGLWEAIFTDIYASIMNLKWQNTTHHFPFPFFKEESPLRFSVSDKVVLSKRARRRVSPCGSVSNTRPACCCTGVVLHAMSHKLTSLAILRLQKEVVQCIRGPCHPLYHVSGNPNECTRCSVRM